MAVEIVDPRIKPGYMIEDPLFKVRSYFVLPRVRQRRFGQFAQCVRGLHAPVAKDAAEVMRRQVIAPYALQECHQPCWIAPCLPSGDTNCSGFGVALRHRRLVENLAPSCAKPAPAGEVALQARG